MAQIARLVVPGLPHHVTQRGNRRQATFFSDDDHRLYMALLNEWAGKAGTAIWAWCLMPNYVHLILVPSHADGLRAALSETCQAFHFEPRAAFDARLFHAKARRRKEGKEREREREREREIALRAPVGVKRQLLLRAMRSAARCSTLRSGLSFAPFPSRLRAFA